ncbi:MAG: AEC family transporter [Eubacteriales bacterium]|nr:AEC family transporter [Eubacteriales bacterium]
MYAKYFVLFAILFTGWFLRKINFIDDKMNHSMNKLIVYFAYPCLIVHNIGNVDMTGELVLDFLITFIISLVCFFIYGAFSFGYAKARKFPADISNVAEFAMSTPNNGFMGFPVSLIFFGEKGLFLMLAHNAAMNFYIFTYCTSLLNRNNPEKKKPTIRNIARAICKFLMNPNILALFVGFAISLTGGILPKVIDEYLLYIGNVSTPMAMIFIGSSLATAELKRVFTARINIEASIVKLIILPLLTIALVMFLPVEPLIKSIAVLGIAFPTAATVSMLAEQEKQSVLTASRILVLSTIASIATVPGTISLLNRIF